MAALWEVLESRVMLSSTLVHLTAHPVALRTAMPSFEKSSVPASTTAADADGYTPAQIQTAYAMSGIVFGSVTGDGTGQTIAIIDAFNDPTIQADLRTFDSTFSLSTATLTVEGQTGSSTLPRTDPAGRGNSWAVETSLDVEWAHAVAPGAKILLIEANSDSDSDLAAAVATARAAAGVSVVTMSFGSAETSSDPSSNADYTTPPGHIGETFVASAGDNGAYGDGGNTKAVEYPAASPNVLAVGGTNLNVADDGTYISESAWGDGSTSGNDGGGGGGISKYETQPAYQKGVVTQSTTKRTLPDVSIEADPNTGVDVVDSYDSPSSPWMVLGGTSLAAPMWAGIVAIADQGRVLAGEGTMNGATQTLPALYALSSADFHDVTTGNNGYAAGAGYDLASGRGTPITNLVVGDLVSGSTTTTPPPPPVTPTIVPAIGAFTVTPGSVVAGTTLTLTAKGVTETGGTVSSVLFYRETNGTSGLQVGSDTLIGSGTASGTTWTIKTSTSGFGGGSYTYYAVAVDAAGVSSGAALASATVVAPTISLSAVPSGVVSGTNFKLSALGVAEAGGTVVSVVFYRESNNDSGLQVGADTQVGSGVKSGTTWSLSTSTTGLTAGTYTYYAVATDKAGVQTVASTTEIITAASNLPNDNFANATVLNGTSASVTGTNVGATHELHEPFVEKTGGKSVWYSWTAPASGTVMLTTVGSDFDTVLGVYKGKVVSKLTLVTQNDDASFDELTSAVTFKATAGTTYHFAVDGYNGAAGNIVLNLTEVMLAVTKK